MHDASIGRTGGNVTEALGATATIGATDTAAGAGFDATEGDDAGALGATGTASTGTAGGAIIAARICARSSTGRVDRYAIKSCVFSPAGAAGVLVRTPVERGSCSLAGGGAELGRGTARGADEGRGTCGRTDARAPGGELFDADAAAGGRDVRQWMPTTDAGFEGFSELRRSLVRAGTVLGRGGIELVPMAGEV